MNLTDKEIIKVGDVCTYSYDTKNKSLSIVEVVRELSEECVVVKFHQVIVDESGNDFFTYLCNNEKTMNVSRKYLNKIDLINRLQDEREALINGQETLQKTIVEQKAEIELLQKMQQFIKSEAIKEFEKLVVRRLNCNTSRGAYLLNIMSEVKKEMTESVNYGSSKPEWK